MYFICVHNVILIERSAECTVVLMTAIFRRTHEARNKRDAAVGLDLLSVIMHFKIRLKTNLRQVHIAGNRVRTAPLFRILRFVAASHEITSFAARASRLTAACRCDQPVPDRSRYHDRYDQGLRLRSAILHNTTRTFWNLFSSPFTVISGHTVFHKQLCMVLVPFFASFNAVVNNDGKAPCQFYDLGDLGWVLLKHRKL